VKNNTHTHTYKFDNSPLMFGGLSVKGFTCELEPQSENKINIEL